MRAIALVAVLLPSVASAESTSVAVNFGLIQPIVLGGANIEVDFRRGPFVASYSHGWSLDLSGGLITGEQRDQHLRLHVPYTTGVGVGLGHHFERAHLFVDARAELKLHRFEPAVEDASKTTVKLLPAYSTLTLGGGLYATYVPSYEYPVDISVSVRYWPNVWSSLEEGGMRYDNPTTQRMETMHAANIGIANTPIVANVSVGYMFD